MKNRKDISSGYRPGVTFEEFEKIVKEIKKAEECYDEFYRLTRKYSNILGDAEAPMPTGYWLAGEVLGKALGLGEDDIVNWWMQETDYGRDWKDGMIIDESLEENHKYYEPKLKTLKQLYEYCLFLGERYYTERN